MKTNVNSQYVTDDFERVCQGSIFRDFKVDISILSEDGSRRRGEFTYPYAIVLSQDCDLEIDFKFPSDNDKSLKSVLVCPAFPAERVKEGTHLSDLGIVLPKKDDDIWKQIKRNMHLRYHYLDGDQEKQIQDLILDFKRYHTVEREILYYELTKTGSCKGIINELYREALSQRFSYYLSRVALPGKDESDSNDSASSEAPV